MLSMQIDYRIARITSNFSNLSVLLYFLSSEKGHPEEHVRISLDRLERLLLGYFRMKFSLLLHL